MNTLINLVVNNDGGLTVLGYVLCIALAIAALVLAIIFSKKSSNKYGARSLAVCSACLALAFVLSFVKVLPMPFGGSVTLCSMLFISLAGYFYGIRTGLLIGFVYGIMQFLQGPYILSLFQVLCDYLLAFTCLGLSGLFAGKKHGLTIGYLVAVVGRAVFHSLGGYLYWMDYMPDDFPKALAFGYPIIYNFSFILAEAVITIIIINLPPVKKGIAQAKSIARGNQ